MSDETNSKDGNSIGRRAVLAGAAVLAAAPSALAAKPRPERLPVAFVPHGGGPWPFVDVGFGSKDEADALASYLRELPGLAKTKPKAVVVISAHWEEPAITVMTARSPPLFFDYYGFPEAAYALTWPAQGSPEIAERVRALAAGAGFPTAANPSRGYDHGAFVVMKVAWPDADVPTIQVSLKRGLNAEEHLKLGRALAPLRDEGVLLIGSGMTFHNLRGFGPQGVQVSETFDRWLRETALLEQKDRDARLANWTDAPAARAAHPREEHLLPLMVIAGAAGADRGQVAYQGTYADIRLSGYRFG